MISLKRVAKILGHQIRAGAPKLTGNHAVSEKKDATDAVMMDRAYSQENLLDDRDQRQGTCTENVFVSPQSGSEKNVETDLKYFPNAGQQGRAAGTNPYKHLLTGVSYMLPMVVTGGIFIALALAFSGVSDSKEGSIVWALNLISSSAFKLLMPVLSGFISFSIVGRPGLAPGLIGGMLAHQLNIGFLGGIVAGLMAGYVVKFLINLIRLPATLDKLKAILIVPCLSSILVGLTMLYCFEPPLHFLLDALTEWMRNMQGTNALLLGALLGGMMAFDMGGPINKTAGAFAVGLLTSKVYTPMAAVMIGGMTPPLGVAVAAWLFKGRFNLEERNTAASAFVLGLSYITEGALPFAAKDPFRVIPATVIGGSVAGAISMLFEVELLVPHGGAFTILIPGAVKPLAPYGVALLIGVSVTAGLLFIFKKPIIRKNGSTSGRTN